MNLSIKTVHRTLVEAKLLTESKFEVREHLYKLVTDSRQVDENSIFLAISGLKHDGHRHLEQAIEGGARLVIVEDSRAIPDSPQASWILVSDSRAAWSWLAAAACGHPQRQLQLFGVTGTNGKTSTVWIFNQIMLQLRKKCLSIGTLGIYLGEKKLADSLQTTPDPDVLFPLLQDFAQRGGEFVVLEASSHSVAQKRLAPIKFHCGAWTSFSRDHLDYHKTMLNYWQQKWEFCSNYVHQKGRVVLHEEALAFQSNSELRQSDAWLVCEGGETNSNARKLPYNPIKFHDSSSNELIFEAQSQKVRKFPAPYLGKHNKLNFLFALLMVEKALGEQLDTLRLDEMQPIPGRLEQMRATAAGGPPEVKVFVDYAHTPDALSQTLSVLRRDTLPAGGRLWVIFGCGGQRDVGKRQLMGSAAEAGAERIIITSDNPRGENQQTIGHDIARGIRDFAKVRQISDREQAIAHAVKEANSQDVILIAGKGHETTQDFGDHKVPFDDRTVAQKYLEKRKDCRHHV